MGEIVSVYLTDEELEMMGLLSDFYGEKSQSRIVKLAVRKLYKNKICIEHSEWGPDEELEAVKKSELF